MIETFENDGFCIAAKVLDQSTVAGLIAVLERANVACSKRGEDVFGARNLLDVPEIAILARAPSLIALVQTALGNEVRAIRGIFFDKTPVANWPVAWHQDLTLAVAARREISGWTNWTIKGGSHHVNPPVPVLESMVTLRIMLDDCDADNGPLRVQPRSHRLGRLTREQIVDRCATNPERECLGRAGDVLIMRPLLLHASSAARNPHHRRVIHLEYVAAHLIPENLVAGSPLAIP